MDRFDIEIEHPSGAQVLWPNGVTVHPIRFGWSAIGGPRDAEIEVTGAVGALYALLAYPGHRVIIRNRYAQACWWGYVEEATLSLGQVELGVSLAPMYNRISVAYTYQDETGAAQRGTSDWVQDATSVAAYGAKELLYSRSDLDDATAATELATTLLARFKNPAATIRSGGGQRNTARLTCRGYWETVGWKYYKQLMGREAHERLGGGDQVLGVGMTDSVGHVRFEGSSKRVYQVGGQHGFKAGDKVIVAGTSLNNGTKTIVGATQKDILSYSATTISFVADDDIWDTASGFDSFEVNDIIQIRGSVANVGMAQIGSLEDYGTPGGTDYDHIEVADRTIVAEAAGPTIILNRYGYFNVKEYTLTEQPGPGMSLTTWGQWIGQAWSLENSTDAWTVSEVKVRIRKRGTPADGVQLAVRADSPGTPGAFLDSVTVAAADIPEEYEWVTFDLADTFTPVFGTAYWITLNRTGTMDADNYYEVAVDEEELYPRGWLLLYTGTTWEQRPAPSDLVFQILGKQDTGGMIKRIVDETATHIAVCYGMTTGVTQYRDRDGDDSARDEIERLLELGDSSHNRILIDVRPNRDLHVLSKAAYDAAGEVYRMDADGTVTDRWGRPLGPGLPLYGKWIEMDVAGLPDALTNAFVFFVEGAEYDVASGAWRLEPENAPTPFEIGKMMQG